MSYFKKVFDGGFSGLLTKSLMFNGRSGNAAVWKILLTIIFLGV